MNETRTLNTVDLDRVSGGAAGTPSAFPSFASQSLSSAILQMLDDAAAKAKTQQVSVAAAAAPTPSVDDSQSAG